MLINVKHAPFTIFKQDQLLQITILVESVHTIHDFFNFNEWIYWDLTFGVSEALLVENEGIWRIDKAGQVFPLVQAVNMSE